MRIEEYSKSIDKRYAKDIVQVTGKRLTCNKHVKMISNKSYMNMYSYMKCICISL